MENKKKTTIKDIAKALNITPSAVSKALSDHPRISDKTKKAVKKVAKTLNYQPNHLASALRKGKSNLVGVIVPRANSNFFSSVVEKIEERLSKEGYNVIITQSNESFSKECKNIESLLYTQVDGIIASMANETTVLDHYENIKSKGVPLIMFDRGEDTLEVDYVGIDDYNSSFAVVEHLKNQGCKRIAHIGGYSHTRIYKNRIIGYKEALESFNLPIENELIHECNLTIEDGRRIMQQLLELPKPPDAVFAASDFAALGALQILEENNIAIPNDIALVGFSNETFTSLIKPSISTVNQRSERIGTLAAETFLKRVNDTNWKPKLNKIIVDSELIIRDSSNKSKLLD
ncbi:LacI family DNA-binding transcriptional regulator [Snuella sedimenti]|uniref:LacI family DNA-binding transcriptional regulator n=1 Tax=Snuella sedimenti TaxID=2798802 RepID=A0A8J7IV81_9FLAO|nr:LacI family DNA-binding transcriptional regulator [Snuella sedimenti]MBJ6368390.1 LacI family DNA-binding transcriptional regulator [Snuella sedimenti]